MKAQQRRMTSSVILIIRRGLPNRYSWDCVVSTKAEVRFHVRSATWLNDYTKQRIEEMVRFHPEIGYLMFD